MRITRISIVATAAAVALVPALALGQNRPPRTGSATLDVRQATIVFGETAALSGRVNNTSSDRGVTVRLEADDSRPYGDSYTNTGATTRTAGGGRFTFDTKPARNTQYRVIAESSPPVTSGARLVTVRTRVGLIVSDSTPRRGQRVRFSGSVTPEHDGRQALIQRQGTTGRFVTIARATLTDAGTQRSRYSRRVRIRRDGAYRVKVAGDADHVNGFSTERRLDVHG